MGLFTRREPRVTEATLREVERRRILAQAKEGMKKERRKKLLADFRKEALRARQIIPKEAQFRRQREGVMGRFGEFVGVGARRREEPFTREQEAMREIIGGRGEKIWGWKNEPVRINNDLHPSLSDSSDETASLFGFGRRV